MREIKWNSDGSRVERWPIPEIPPDLFIKAVRFKLNQANDEDSYLNVLVEVSELFAEWLSGEHSADSKIRVGQQMFQMFVNFNLISKARKSGRYLN